MGRPSELGEMEVHGAIDLRAIHSSRKIKREERAEASHKLLREGKLWSSFVCAVDSSDKEGLLQIHEDEQVALRKSDSISRTNHVPSVAHITCMIHSNS